MAEDPTFHEPDDTEPDAVEAELIAYLDGELDPAEERRVEEKMASDPALRARADALQRSYDLLEFLPKPEPSPTFASRTLDRLPAVKSGSVAPVSAGSNTPAPAAASSSSPVLLSSSSTPSSMAMAGGPRPRGWSWPFGLAAAIGIALIGGYFGAAAAQSYFFPAPAPPKLTAENLPLADLRVVQNLPLYAAVDNLEFLDELATIFREEESLAADGPAPAAAPERSKPTGGAFDTLLRAFTDLPGEQQDRIRALDQQIHDQPPERQVQLFRVLESYAAWLQRIPDAERKQILAAATPERRIETIRDVRRAQWVARLPAAMRQKLDNAIAEDRATLITEWKAEERQRREEWHLARANWESLRTGRPPWPFADEAMKQAVLDFMERAYHPGDPRRCRLTSTGPRGGDRGRLEEVLERAVKGNEWVLLGKVLYDLSQNPRYEMLPEPRDGMPLTEYEQLWPAAAQFYEKKAPRGRLDTALGKWPDFALAVSEAAERSKTLSPPPDFSFGPCRPGEFRPETERFIERELPRKANRNELGALKKLEGQWPEYPRELIRLAKSHDLSVPGAMLPGPLSRWEKTYNFTPAPRRR
jgi:hypothetical protein